MEEENENIRKTDTKNDVMNCLIKVEQKKDKISIYVKISWNGSHHGRKEKRTYYEIFTNNSTNMSYKIYKKNYNYIEEIDLINH